MGCAIYLTKIKLMILGLVVSTNEGIKQNSVLWNISSSAVSPPPIQSVTLIGTSFPRSRH